MNFTEVDKGTNMDVQVRAQDQDQINEFSRNNHRLMEKKSFQNQKDPILTKCGTSPYTHTHTHIKNTYTQTHNTYRSSLSASQREAATDLGYDAESWNNEKVRRFFFLVARI